MIEKKRYVPQLLEKMEDYHFVADDEYAEDYVRSYSKNKGKLLIERELKMKGVSDEDMKNALDGLTDESQSALKLAEKYMRNKVSLNYNIITQR